MAEFGGDSANIVTIEPESGLPQVQPVTQPVPVTVPSTEPETGAPVTNNPQTATPTSTVSAPSPREHDNIPVQQTPLTGNQVSGSPQNLSSQAPAAPSRDMRLRLSALDTSIFSGILAPLQSTGGMLWPYTPQIQFSQSVNYMDVQLVHSNTDYPAYTRTPSVSLTINGKFTVQSQSEGRYALACLHFLRAASKSHFGESDSNAGLPPPILTLDGYGIYMFRRLRVVIKTHSWSFDENIDTITIAAGRGLVRLPALFSMSCELTVVQTPARMRQQFSFAQFASGQLMESQEGWI